MTHTQEVTAEALEPCPFCGGAARMEHSFHEDNNRAPRDFWWCRVECDGCGVDLGWHQYGEMEQHKVPDDVKSCAEREAATIWNSRQSTAKIADLTQLVTDARNAGTEKHNRLIEAQAENKRLRDALGFYADPLRYQGANQAAIPEDPFQPGGDYYRRDVTRDNGDIARATLQGGQNAG